MNKYLFGSKSSREVRQHRHTHIRQIYKYINILKMLHTDIWKENFSRYYHELEVDDYWQALKHEMAGIFDFHVNLDDKEEWKHNLIRDTRILFDGLEIRVILSNNAKSCDLLVPSKFSKKEFIKINDKLKRMLERIKHKNELYVNLPTKQ